MYTHLDSQTAMKALPITCFITNTRLSATQSFELMLRVRINLSLTLKMCLSEVFPLVERQNFRSWKISTLKSMLSLTIL